MSFPAYLSLNFGLHNLHSIQMFFAAIIFKGVKLCNYLSLLWVHLWLWGMRSSGSSDWHSDLSEFKLWNKSEIKDILFITSTRGEKYDLDVTRLHLSPSPPSVSLFWPWLVAAPTVNAAVLLLGSGQSHDTWSACMRMRVCMCVCSFICWHWVELDICFRMWLHPLKEH